MQLTVSGNASLSSVMEMAHIDHQHRHSHEFWFGKLAVQTGTAWGDPDTLTPYQAISGDDTWGADADDEAKIIGSADTPILASANFFKIHRLLIVDESSTTLWKFRVVWGTGTMADAITAKQYTEVMSLSPISAGVFAGGHPVDLRVPVLAVGTQVWLQAWNATDDATIDFVVGVHEHNGC